MGVLIGGMIAMFVVIPLTGLIVGWSVYRAVAKRMEEINARAADTAGLPRDKKQHRTHGDD